MSKRIVRGLRIRREKCLGFTLIEALLPSRCNGRPALSTISFFPSGISCGGTVALSRLGARYEIRVNWLTGGIEIVSTTAS